MMLEALMRYRVPIAIAAIVLFAAGLFFLLDHSQKRAVDQARDAGVQQERAAGAAEVVNRTEKANAAVETMRRDPVVRRAECLRDARNPENC